MADQTPEEKEWDKVLRQAWITTSLERDKSIITLSSAGLALLIAFVTKVSAPSCFIRLILLIGLIGFTSSILAGVRCLHVNRSIILQELKRNSETGELLCDKIMLRGFVSGVFSVFVIGIILIATS